MLLFGSRRKARACLERHFRHPAVGLQRPIIFPNGQDGDFQVITHEQVADHLASVIWAGLVHFHKDSKLATDAVGFTALGAQLSNVAQVRSFGQSRPRVQIEDIHRGALVTFGPQFVNHVLGRDQIGPAGVLTADQKDDYAERYRGRARDPFVTEVAEDGKETIRKNLAENADPASLRPKSKPVAHKQQPEVVRTYTPMACCGSCYVGPEINPNSGNCAERCYEYAVPGTNFICEECFGIKCKRQPECPRKCPCHEEEQKRQWAEAEKELNGVIGNSALAPSSSSSPSPSASASASADPPISEAAWSSSSSQ